MGNGAEIRPLEKGTKSPDWLTGYKLGRSVIQKNSHHDKGSDEMKISSNILF